jgi:hypothetical protein
VAALALLERRRLIGNLAADDDAGARRNPWFGVVMSNAALFKTCQTPDRSGFPSGVRWTAWPALCARVSAENAAIISSVMTSKVTRFTFQLEASSSE